jgi:hypothetical protein
MPYAAFDARRLRQALRRLGELAQEQAVTLELSLYGGAVFTLVYGSRDATKDVDAVVHPGEVAAELGLPEDWLNDDVRQFLAAQEAKRQLPGDEFGPGLRILVPTAAYLLALKLRACRPPLPGYPGDHGDIRFLVGKLGLRSVAEAVEIHERFFPHDELTAVAREVVQGALTSPPR